MKKLFGLLGYPLSHSFSASYFKNKFQQEGVSKNFDYRNFEIATIDSLQKVIRTHPDLCGLNVTIPYKQSVIKYIDRISEAASSIGAVNTIKIDRSPNRILYGDNTDWIGFQESLLGFIGNKRPRALILGTGGSSKAVEFVLNNLGIIYKRISRNSDFVNDILDYKHVTSEHIIESELIINTTPLGMFPNTSGFPDIPYQFIGTDHFLFDLIYNPDETEFLKKGAAQGAKTKNGKEMLKLQANASWNIWMHEQS